MYSVARFKGVDAALTRLVQSYQRGAGAVCVAVTLPTRCQHVAITPIGKVMWRGPPPPFYPSSDHTAKDRCVLSEVIPSRLYLTNFKGAAETPALQDLKVTHIASVGDEFEDPAINGLIHWTKAITDDENQGDVMAVILRDGARFIHDAIEGKGCVVVHCAAGISRSATILLGYYVLHGGCSLREAFAHVFACRPCIWPNEGFMAALVDLERAVRGSTSLTTTEYEHWGEYEGPEEGDEVAPNMPPPRLVRDDTCLDTEERELEALEAEASRQRKVQEQEKQRKLLASLGDSADAAEAAEGHFGTGGDEGLLSLDARLRRRLSSAGSLLGAATRRVQQLQLKRIIVSWLKRKKIQPVEPDPSVNCGGAAAGDTTAKEVKPPKKANTARSKPKPKQKKRAARKITPE